MSSTQYSMDGLNETTEFYFSEVLAGKPDVVRQRLIDAMESVGFDILEVEPNIIGRRAARGWGTYGSTNVLDYPATLIIRIWSVGENSTQTTFDYQVRHGWLNEGEKNIVAQEARTIAALARVPSIAKLCPGCGLDSAGESRFCRRCGTPLTSESLEMEVLRLMAETRAAKTSVVAASVATIPAAVGLAIAFISSLTGLLAAKPTMILFIASMVVLLVAMMSSFFGWNRLKRALTKQPADERPRVPMSSTVGVTNQHELDEARPYLSVTEGTTNLLDSNFERQNEHEEVLVPRGKRTGEFE